MTRNIKYLKYTLAVLIILFVSLSIKNFLKYSQLFDDGIWHASISYQLYALVYVIQVILALVVFIFVYQIFSKVNVNTKFKFSDKMLYTSMCILIFVSLQFLIDFLHVDQAIVSVLDIGNLTATLLVVINLLLLSFTTIYRKSQEIKEENDLTI
ncbi:TPA: hypothetical protein R1966_001771 [Staphylococcus delphini]|nr:hypothetical protein [Staphylococcus delphini]HEC2226545.1 hypothetical protein [Staphylococcus delphini]